MLIKKDRTKNETKDNKNPKNPYAENPSQEKENPTKSYQDHGPDKRSQGKTRITIKYDVGFSNRLFIRGKGANLNWDKGQPLKNIKSDEWVWETDAHFSDCEFKILINDHVYENGDNHHLRMGANLMFTPHFY